MSSDSPPPSADTLQKWMEGVETLFRLLVETFRRGTWVKRLLLIDALILFGLNPGVAEKISSTMLGGTGTLPDWYSQAFGVALGAVFVAALVVAVRSLPRLQPEAADAKERKTIKGLRPFTKDDAEIFARLQRQRELQECLEVVTSKEFRFGILVGESGCGKTSFLQAGLLPQLSTPEATHRAIYVKFSDRPPITTITQAVVEQLSLTAKPAWDSDLLAMLSEVTAGISQPLVLLFDQFEQFFVHYKQTGDREPFIQAVTELYHSNLPVKVLVCMRGDLSDRLIELYKALNYSPSPYEMVPLKKFSPEQATRVLQVIAETEHLEIDERFVMELAEQELASREDGLISPVDVQILAWMIERQNTAELRAFNRVAFQKFGGVEGLLTRFLERSLEARVTTTQRQTTVKVLLALTDLDRQVRAGALTVGEMQQKLQGAVNEEEIREAIAWLSRSEVRLVTVVERSTERGYELSHERLIPALMRLAGKELSEADRANQLLDRRVNEWLGNQRHRRYVFNWRELRSLKQQQPFLVWGGNRRAKEQLIRQSRRWLYGWVGSGAALLLVLTTYYAWLWFTPWGQMQQVRWELTKVSAQVDDSSAGDAVVALAKDDHWQQALMILEKEIGDPGPKAFALSEMAKVALAFKGETSVTKAKSLLTEAFTAAKIIDDLIIKAPTFSNIASAAAKLNNAALAKSSLAEALTAAKMTKQPGGKALAFGRIALTAAKLNDTTIAKSLLKEVLAVAKTIEEPSSKVQAFRNIALAAAKLNDAALAKSSLAEALTAAKTINESDFRSVAFSYIALAAARLNNTAIAKSSLTEALTAAKTIDIDESFFNVTAFSNIASAAAKLNNTAIAKLSLTKAFTVAMTIDDRAFKASMFSDIALAAAKLNNTAIAKSWLIETLIVAKTIDEPASKADAFRAIADAYIELKDTASAKAILQQAWELAVPTKSSDTLGSIATTYAKLGNWERAIQIAQYCEANDKISALSQILTLHAEQQNPALVKLREAEEREQEEEN